MTVKFSWSRLCKLYFNVRTKPTTHSSTFKGVILSWLLISSVPFQGQAESQHISTVKMMYMWDRVEFWIPDLSSIQKAESCLIVEWCGIWMASEYWASIVMIAAIKWLLSFKYWSDIQMAL